MKREKPHFHPRSPIQPDRTSPIPFLILALLGAALAWNSRENWVDWLAPPNPQQSNESLIEKSGQLPTTRAQENLLALFTPEDYPLEALRNNEQGKVVVALSVDAEGRVRACRVTHSSGYRSLDAATCNILSRRAQFTPARDSEGRAALDSYVQTVSWRLEG